MTVSDAQIPEGKCWWCGEIYDHVSHMDPQERSPEKDDLNVCIHCGCPGVFTEDLHIVEPNKEQIIEFFLDHDACVLWMAIVETAKERGKTRDQLWEMDKKPLV